MEKTGQSSKCRIGIATALLVLLTACAQTETRQSGDMPPAQQSAQVSASAADKADKRVEPVSAEAEPNYLNMNPVPIAFDKMGVKLNDAGKQLIAKLGDRAKKSKKVVIVGYCDRKQVGNAHAAALARASAVRSELVHLGVKPASIQLKTVTNAAEKHLAEIQFS